MSATNPVTIATAAAAAPAHFQAAATAGRRGLTTEGAALTDLPGFARFSRKAGAGRSSLRFGRGGHGRGVRGRVPAGGSGRFIGRILQKPRQPLGQDLSRAVHEHPGVARAGAESLGDFLERVAQALQLHGTALGDRQLAKLDRPAPLPARGGQPAREGRRLRLSASERRFARTTRRARRFPGSACAGRGSSCRYMRL